MGAAGHPAFSSGAVGCGRPWSAVATSGPVSSVVGVAVDVGVSLIWDPRDPIVCLGLWFASCSVGKLPACPAAWPGELVGARGRWWRTTGGPAAWPVVGTPPLSRWWLLGGPPVWLVAVLLTLLLWPGIGWPLLRQTGGGAAGDSFLLAAGAGPEQPATVCCLRRPPQVWLAPDGRQAKVRTHQAAMPLRSPGHSDRQGLDARIGD